MGIWALYSRSSTTLSGTVLRFGFAKATHRQFETVDALCFQGELRHGQIERPLTLRSGQAGVYCW